jgi:hypothetical protein
MEVKRKMELKQIRAKKSLKLLSLLLTSLLIFVASATVYNYMYLQGTVTIGSAQIVWVKGSGAPSGTTITGGTVTMGLSAQPGQNQTTLYALYLKNNNATVTYNMNITVTTALSSTYFNSANIYLYNNVTSAYITSISMTSVNTYTTTLAGSGVDKLNFQIYAKNSTTSGQYSFNIQVTYW